MNYWRIYISAMLAPAALMLCGCDIGGTNSATARTDSLVRAERRQFDGAPPVIPHQPLDAACTTCHTQSGKEVPNQGFAPANPHFGTSVAGAMENCRQCHVFRAADEPFVESQFVGLRQDLRRGDRLFDGAPPVIPHQALMRENCAACHDGPSARPEIRCSHPERYNCVQCHVRSDVAGTADAFPAIESLSGTEQSANEPAP